MDNTTKSKLNSNQLDKNWKKELTKMKKEDLIEKIIKPFLVDQLNNKEPLELTNDQMNKGLDIVRFDQFTSLVNIKNLKMSLTQMMLRDTHRNSAEFTNEEVEDFTALIFLLEDLE